VGKLTFWSTFSNLTLLCGGFALRHLVFRDVRVQSLPSGTSRRARRIPTQIPRPSPRTLVGLRLGSDLDSGLGRLALSFAGLSVDRGGRAYPSPSTPLGAKFYRVCSADAVDGGDDEEDRHADHERDRSRPETGGTQRRTGASTGSVVRKTRRCHWAFRVWADPRSRRADENEDEQCVERVCEERP